MDEEGYFVFVDRKKDMIKRAGENVSASEVEESLKQIEAYVILKEGAAATAEERVAWCRARLSLFRVPEIVEFRREFPRTSVGKIQKHLF